MSYTWIVVTEKIQYYVLYYSVLQTQQLRNREHTETRIKR